MYLVVNVTLVLLSGVMVTLGGFATVADFHSYVGPPDPTTFRIRIENGSVLIGPGSAIRISLLLLLLLKRLPAPIAAVMLRSSWYVLMADVSVMSRLPT